MFDYPFTLESVARSIAWALLISPFIGFGWSVGASCWSRPWPWRKCPA